MSVRRTTTGRVAVLELDHPERSANVVDEAVLAELDARAREVLADPAVDAVVLASGKRAFGAGADVAWLPDLAARDDAEDFLAGVHDLMTLLVGSDKPLVAALHGFAFGGALELALGGDEIIAAEGTRLGLPEVTLALLPGGGGTQLLGRFLPVGVAADLLTSGRNVDAAEAVEIGLVREVVPADRLRERAVELATELVGQPRRGWPTGSTAQSQVDLDGRRKQLEASRGGLSTAAATILTVLETGARDGHVAGLAAERRGFLHLLRSPEARAATHLFLLEKAASRGSSADAVAAQGPDSLAVVGGGQMGAGIAATAVVRGVRATVRDLAPESVERASAYMQKVLSRRGGDQERARELWSGTTSWDGFADADLVVEAVFEDPDLKRTVLADVSAQVKDDAVLATNTSAISVESLAGAVTGPERFLGMHFFSPVERMPLVELIPHPGTSPAAVSRATAAGRRLGKVTVTVGDAPGFFTSRVYARWLIEGVRLVLDGVDPGLVDAAAKRAGFPVGPLQAHDEATLELVLAASIGQVALRIMQDRLDVDEVRAALEKLVASGIGGRRSKRGFYVYDENGKRSGVNADVTAVLGVDETTDIAPAVVEQRLLMAFVSECLLCWDDGTLCHPTDGDLAAVLGIGFPRVLGGPFHWVDETGPERVASLSATLGSDAFPTGQRLLALAAVGGRLSAEPRRAKPFDPIGAG